MIPIEHGKYYHIFNRGNNYEDIFKEKSDYLQFLSLMDIYITSVADIYAWALLGNHFHLLVRIKEEDEIGLLNSENAKSDDLELKWRTYFPDNLTIPCPADEGIPNDMLSSDVRRTKYRQNSEVGQSNMKKEKFTKKPRPSQQFKHFFNTYASWYNRKYGRIGSLFIKNFERKLVDNERYLRNLIIYIHKNPIHHNFAEHIVEYPWTSYLTIVSVKPTKLHRKSVLGYFDDRANLKYLHQQEDDFDNIEDLIIE